MMMMVLTYGYKLWQLQVMKICLCNLHCPLSTWQGKEETSCAILL
jgi:hypothetical protein